jgi:glutathione S-transferase
MKLYDGIRTPNPRRVRIFLAEKGISVPSVPIDLGKLEQRHPEFATKNPMQAIPVLELDDGTVISESVAICRYFEEVQPDPPLFGVGAKERAIVEMWNRRLDLGLFTSIAHVFRHSHPFMAEMEKPQVPAWAEANKQKVRDTLYVLNEQLARHTFVTGETYTVADITAQVAVDFMKVPKLAVPEDCTHVLRWHALVSARASSGA